MLHKSTLWNRALCVRQRRGSFGNLYVEVSDRVAIEKASQCFRHLQRCRSTNSNGANSNNVHGDAPSFEPQNATTTSSSNIEPRMEAGSRKVTLRVESCRGATTLNRMFNAGDNANNRSALNNVLFVPAESYQTSRSGIPCRISDNASGLQEQQLQTTLHQSFSALPPILHRDVCQRNHSAPITDVAKGTGMTAQCDSLSGSNGRAPTYLLLNLGLPLRRHMVGPVFPEGSISWRSGNYENGLTIPSFQMIPSPLVVMATTTTGTSATAFGGIGNNIPHRMQLQNPAPRSFPSDHWPRGWQEQLQGSSISSKQYLERVPLGLSGKASLNAQGKRKS